MAKVGLFWGYQHRIYTHSIDVKKGHDDGHFVNGLYDHVEYWPLLVRQHKELVPFEYQDIPRGRVIYIKEPETYRILGDKKLSIEIYRRLVVEKFALEGHSLAFMHDVHYTTDLEELDGLFSD